MQINYSRRLDTYVCQDNRGNVLGIYCAKKHGTVEEFRNEMAAMVKG